MAPLRILSHMPASTFAVIEPAMRDTEVIEIPAQGEIPAGANGEVLFTFAWGSPNLREAVSRGVRWVHTMGTGVDRFPLDALSGQRLTCSRGASATPISEWVLAVMLAFEKQLPESFVAKPPARWNMAELGGLAGKTLGLLGIGGIGLAVAKRALAFEMRVIAHRRTAKPCEIAEVELVDLPELWRRSDHLVVAASSTPATRHLLDAKAFSQMRPGVHLTNIARGGLIDQDALRAALDSGRVARASLDVCDPEPLPEGHWLYAHPRVRLSPHISWSMPGAVPALIETFGENLRRYRRGEPLVGQVDLAAGY
jgi:phosphoglycerate dehydrogenase-like enzyme